MSQAISCNGGESHPQRIGKKTSQFHRPLGLSLANSDSAQGNAPFLCPPHKGPSDQGLTSALAKPADQPNRIIYIRGKNAINVRGRSTLVDTSAKKQNAFEFKRA